MAFPATHAKRDAIVLQASRGFASAPNSPRVFLHHHASNNKRSDVVQKTIHNADISNKLSSPSIIDGMVCRICALFPTAREYDVKELLVKYHYRETVVVSALQVLKYPLTMPGPAAVAAKNNNNYENSLSITTPPMRHLPTYYVAPSSQAAWSETLSDGRTSKLGAFSTNSNTPVHSPAPHRSPKIKLKYLKSVFPKAEETFLLDLLVGSDNNVNKVTQQLLTLGHQKKDKPQPLTPRRSLMTPTPVPKETVEMPTSPKKLPSFAEMFQIKSELQELFPDEEEAVIQLALESADFNLEKAQIILTASQEREESFSTVKTLTLSGIKHTVTMSSLKSSPSVLSTFKDIASLSSPMKETAHDEESFRYKPKHQPLIEESDKCHGPNNSLISDKYVRPNGPSQSMAKGPNSSLLSLSRSTAMAIKENRVGVKGPDPSNRQGPSVKPRVSLSSFISSKFKRESLRRI